MTLRSRGPWLVSLGLHAVVLALGATLLVTTPRTTPGVLRMRLAAPAGPAAAAPTVSSTAWVPPAATAARATEPVLPAWRGSTPAVTAPPPAVPPVSLDELLRGVASESAEQPPNSDPADSTAGWSGPSGQGYTAPPLPPPGLAPPQGARWVLSLSIPAGGGPARSVDGLDSGHPELDRWLEEYLRTVSFPSSPDGNEYQLRWSLVLSSGRPE